ncbi:hypothetical protein CHGG_03297 [Chaetomium globosum CBS 148.51]|uniref:Nonsense-mediated mRNA decay factor n=1 Tax=Chaetomium globosum (strain ATCC 6205 / CBS 148.51 / DSM 1962 / NBRC 6347 / NRRL 1970) TaxID=306901 RepID=Q2H907_CHAGB|nr:uncharacterized protein CHGG_03297 [Chaetomium globosum CBS 148.51]EAQ91362.1 hypothetical protein CHGG_03297 [Chaetomium globosum CBS 148.51]
MASTSATGATGAAAEAIPSTDDTWKLAQKLRAAIHKELEHIQKGGPGTNEIARFEKVEKLMQNYRLACIETIWLDLRAANEKGAEDVLWSTHTLVTKTYRKVLGRQGNDHVVLKRKLEKLYSNYLKTAQYFYRGYLQRVCARYDNPDLKRIAQRAELEAMPLPEKDKVDTAAAQLDTIVKQSCHKTLIYLGDLARYRTLLRTKDPKWEGALSYYLLANELIPESGYGHHQCGVICVENEDHLQVVYYLYRALACALPHPNASSNLEREFRDLQKRKDITTKHALVTWFVKLHAFYSQGKEFPERKELESEVDHRLGLAMKTGTGYGSDLDMLKMVLINITAYAAAQDKINKKWTDEGSLSCQFILLLNLRTITAIARLLGEEIAGIIKRMGAETPTGTSTPSQSEPTTKFTPALNRVLTLLRVYMAWLCSYGSQLVEFRAHLEPQLGTMCTTLSNTLTLLFELLGGDEQLGNTVSWRFPEDDITLGIDCLNGPNLHDGCQLYYDAFARKPKPRREDVAGADYIEDDVTFTRALDVLLCGLDLSMPESRFPFATSAVKKGSRELTTFMYLERGKPEPTPNLPPAQHLTPTAVPAALEQTPKILAAALSPCESNELSEDQDFYGPNLRNAVGYGSRSGQVPAPVIPTPTAPVSEFPIERQMFNILNEFINPPESTLLSKSKTPSHPPARTSPYGMDSAGVAEAFGAGTSNSPTPGSAGAKKFPTLPWEYFYKPPANPTLRSDTNAMAASWGANGGGISRPTSSGNAAQFGAGATIGNPLAHQTHQRYGSLGQSKPVENQADMLQSSESASGRAGLPQQAYSPKGAWPNATAEGLVSALGTPPILPQQRTWAPPSSPWQNANGQVPPATTGAALNSSFSTFNFSSNASSLPQVYSPWGIPAAVNRFPAAQSPSSPSRASAAYTGGAIPSPSGSRYATDYASAMASGHIQQNSFAGAWPDARQPRNGSVAQQPLGQVDIWSDLIRQQPTVGEKANRKSVMQQGMPKR